MWKPRTTGHEGWVLPDALMALGIVCLTVILAQDYLQTTQHLAQQRQAQLAVARQRHDQALRRWVAIQ